jgi:hypothetical protein
VFRYHKSANILGVPARKSQIRKSQTRKFLQNTENILSLSSTTTRLRTLLCVKKFKLENYMLYF